ncbi:MAG: hypothetical protein J0M02_06870 [Planctomycetes bacterium]|nr:hypothetical protein [Planctomycetota bacterium]
MSRPLLGRAGWIALVAVILLVACLLWWGRSDAVDRVWYLDLNTQTLFAGPYAAAPPIEAPSGAYDGPDAEDCDHAAGVLAMVVAPKSGGEAQVVYLLRYTRAGRALRQRQLDSEMLSPVDERQVQGELRIAAPPSRPGEAVVWHTMASPAGRAVMDRYDRIMGTGDAVLRLPGD